MINTIKIDGNEYPIIFGWNAIRKFSKEAEVSIGDLQTMITTRMDHALLAIYIGISEGCRKEKKEFKLSIDDFYDMFDADPSAIEKAIVEMANQLKMVLSKINNASKSKNVESPN